MRSSSPPPADDSDDDNYQDLMSTATPVTTPNRNTRKRNADHLGDDGLPLPSLELSLVRTNGNHLGAITSFAARKRLRPEQLTAVEAFARDPLPVQLGETLCHLPRQREHPRKVSSCETTVRNQ
jgi:hypothetical protein